MGGEIKLNQTNSKSNLSGDEWVSSLGINNKVKCQPSIVDGVQYNETPVVSYNDLPIDWLCDAIEQAIDATQYKEVKTFVTDDDLKDTGIQNVPNALIRASFEVILGCRLADLNDLRCGCGRANVEYPSIIGPVVAAYGKVDNSSLGLLIIPKPEPQLVRKLVKMGCYQPKRGVKDPKDISDIQSFTAPEWYKKFMMFFRSYRLMTAYGLPKDKFIKDDAIYQVTELNNRLVGRQPVVRPDTMLIATICKASSLANIFGQYRVEYCAITSMRSAIEDIALKAIHLVTNN